MITSIAIGAGGSGQTRSSGRTRNRISKMNMMITRRRNNHKDQSKKEQKQEDKHQ